jgi:hypothetical protein
MFYRSLYYCIGACVYGGAGTIFLCARCSHGPVTMENFAGSGARSDWRDFIFGGRTTDHRCSCREHSFCVFIAAIEGTLIAECIGRAAAPRAILQAAAGKIAAHAPHLRVRAAATIGKRIDSARSTLGASGRPGCPRRSCCAWSRSTSLPVGRRPGPTSAASTTWRLRPGRQRAMVGLPKTLPPRCCAVAQLRRCTVALAGCAVSCHPRPN